MNKLVLMNTKVSINTTLCSGTNKRKKKDETNCLVQTNSKLSRTNTLGYNFVQQSREQILKLIKEKRLFPTKKKTIPGKV